MNAGFFETDITPPLGMEVPGGYGKAFSSAIHDPLKVRSAVFDDGRERVALVGIDASGISARTVKDVRKRVEKACGIRGECILIDDEIRKDVFFRTLAKPLGITTGTNV